jgi:predicted exporter
MKLPFFSNMGAFRKLHATLALLWLVLVLALATNLALRTQKGSMFESDLLSLLPAAQADAGVQKAVDAVSARLRQQVMFVVRTQPPADAVVAADHAARLLRQSGLFANVQYRISSTDQAALAGAYFPHRFGLLTDADRATLLRQDASPQTMIEPLLQRAFQDLVNPLMPLNADLLVADPLQVFMHFAVGLAHNDSQLRLQNGVLQYRDEHQHAVQIVATLGDGAFDIGNHDRYSELLDTARGDLARNFNGAELLNSGIINYAAQASHSARDEVSVIGIGSTIGIVLLMLLTFRSLRPLWLSLLIIGVGLVVALSTSLLLFGRVHVMTLVFGASLIGVLDYSLHFLVENSLVENGSVKDGTGHAGADGWHCLHLTWPGLVLSMITNVTAYLAMLFAPFPGLRQIAVFSALGLSAACICVLLWFPYLLPRANKARPLKAWRLAHWWLDRWDRAPRATLYLLPLTLIVLAAWVWRAPTDDDIKRLQHAPPELVAQEQALQALAGISNSSQFFLVRGDSLQQVLEREENLRDKLDALLGAGSGALRGYQALSKALPSLARQRDNHQLLLRAVNAGGAALASYSERAGFDESVLHDYVQQLQATPQWLDADMLLANPAFAWRHLLLNVDAGGAGGNTASVMLLSGVRDLSALQAIARQCEGVTLVDHAGRVSSLLGQYRERALLLAAMAYVLALLGLSVRYGMRSALLVLCPPALSALLALAVSSTLALPINLFNSLALLVIMGVGIDYTLFFAENRSARGATMMAVILACLTTELSFGLLALSETPVVRSFGLTMCIGIGCALLLSPMAGAKAFVQQKHS